MNQLYGKKTSQEIRNVTSSFKQLNEDKSSVASNMAGKFGKVENNGMNCQILSFQISLIALYI